MPRAQVGLGHSLPIPSCAWLPQAGLLRITKYHSPRTSHGLSNSSSRERHPLRGLSISQPEVFMIHSVPWMPASLRRQVSNPPKYLHPHQTHLSLQTPLITGPLKLQPCPWGQNQTCPAPCQLRVVEASLCSPGCQEGDLGEDH